MMGGGVVGRYVVASIAVSLKTLTPSYVMRYDRVSEELDDLCVVSNYGTTELLTL